LNIKTMWTPGPWIIILKKVIPYGLQMNILHLKLTAALKP